jgi:hypothetical protein
VASTEWHREKIEMKIDVKSIYDDLVERSGPFTPAQDAVAWRIAASLSDERSDGIRIANDGFRLLEHLNRSKPAPGSRPPNGMGGEESNLYAPRSHFRGFHDRSQRYAGPLDELDQNDIARLREALADEKARRLAAGDGEEGAGKPY